MKRATFNNNAHAIISEVLDEEEMRLFRADICPPHEASEYLTLDYIKTCSKCLEHSVMYLQNEERIGSDIFLAKIARGKVKRRFDLNARVCAEQLAAHTHVYFSEYLPTLRLTYLKILSETADVGTIMRNGVVMLAAASLPGVRTDIRRELRRRGYPYDRTIVSDDTLKGRLESQKGLALAPSL